MSPKSIIAVSYKRYTQRIPEAEAVLQARAKHREALEQAEYDIRVTPCLLELDPRRRSYAARHHHRHTVAWLGKH
jgi:hypothetical protein